MAVYGTLATVRSEVRKLIGNPPTSEVVDTDIDQWLDKAKSSVDTDTGKNDWASTDRQFDDIIYVQNIRAAALGLDHFTSLSDHQKAEDFRKEAKERLQSITMGGIGESPPVQSFIIKSSAYRSSPIKDE